MFVAPLQNGNSPGDTTEPVKKRNARNFLRKGQGLARFQKGGMAKRTRSAPSKATHHEPASDPQTRMHAQHSARDNGRDNATTVHPTRGAVGTGMVSRGSPQRSTHEGTLHTHVHTSTHIRTHAQQRSHTNGQNPHSHLHGRDTDNGQTGRRDAGNGHSVVGVEDDNGDVPGDNISEVRLHTCMTINTLAIQTHSNGEYVRIEYDVIHFRGERHHARLGDKYALACFRIVLWFASKYRNASILREAI